MSECLLDDTADEQAKLEGSKFRGAGWRMPCQGSVSLRYIILGRAQKKRKGGGVTLPVEYA